MIAQWPPQPTPQTLHRKDSQDKRELTPTAGEVFNDVLFTWHCHCLLPHPPHTRTTQTPSIPRLLLSYNNIAISLHIPTSISDNETTDVLAGYLKH